MSTPKAIDLGKARSLEKTPSATNAPHPREPGLHFIRQVKTRFDQQYPRIPFGPNHKRTSFVPNPFRPRIK